jgi:hypothetical protein
MPIVPINRPRPIPPSRYSTPEFPAKSVGVPAAPTRSRIRPLNPESAPVPIIRTRTTAAPAALPAPPVAPADAALPPPGAPPKVKQGRGHPPVEHQFKKGNKGGPGRPKGSKNHTTVMKELFEKKRTVRIDGVERVATQHEILAQLRFKQALEGKEKPLAQLLGEAARLYPANDPGEAGSGAAAIPLSPAEQMILDQMLETMGLPPMAIANLPGSKPLEEFLGPVEDANVADEADDAADTQESL